MEVKQLVGWNIRRVRQERGLTIEALAHQAHVSAAWLGEEFKNGQAPAVSAAGLIQRRSRLPPVSGGTKHSTRPALQQRCASNTLGLSRSAVCTPAGPTTGGWRARSFGPVLVAICWSDEAEAIRMANDSHYGLAAYVWTQDIGAGLRTAHAIEAGWVQVNQGGGQVPGMSYGGFKQSGIGREFSLEGMLDSFTQRKSVTVNLAV
jgi:hypothetical protein